MTEAHKSQLKCLLLTHLNVNCASDIHQAAMLFAPGLWFQLIEEVDIHAVACRPLHMLCQCFRPAHQSANASWMGSCLRHSRCWKELTVSGIQPAKQLRTWAGATVFQYDVMNTVCIPFA